MKVLTDRYHSEVQFLIQGPRLWYPLISSGQWSHFITTIQCTDAHLYLAALNPWQEVSKSLINKIILKTVSVENILFTVLPMEFQFFGGWGTYLWEISSLFSELQRKVFFSVRISFFKIVLLAFTYRLVSKVYLTEQYGENGYLILSSQWYFLLWLL